MPTNSEYRFICAAKMAERMDRVILLAGGIVKEKTTGAKGTIITVMKAE